MWAATSAKATVTTVAALLRLPRCDHQLRQERLRLEGLRRLPAARTAWAAELDQRYSISASSRVSGTAHRCRRQAPTGLRAGAYRPSTPAAAGAAWRASALACASTSKVDHDLGEIEAGDHSKNGWHPYYGLGVNYEIAKNIKLLPGSRTGTTPASSARCRRWRRRRTSSTLYLLDASFGLDVEQGPARWHWPRRKSTQGPGKRGSYPS